MIRLRLFAGVMGIMSLIAGSACASEPDAIKSVEKVTGHNEGAARHDATPIVPYSHACQTKEFAPTCLGRLGNWFTYRPLCDCAPCEAHCGPRCYPPLFSYFTTSPFNRCHKPYDCGECNKSWFSGWRKTKCASDKSCAAPCESKGPWTISVVFPGISVKRAGEVCETTETCPTPKRERVCAPTTSCPPCPTIKDRFMTLPRPISAKASENSSAGCPEGKCSELTCSEPKCGPRVFSGKILNRVTQACATPICAPCSNGKCCSGPVHSPVDFQHLPILPPQNIKGCKPGQLNTATTVQPTIMPPAPAAPAAPVGEVIPAPGR